jgi:DNA-binding NarL/FixJ family response regulator
VNTPIRVLIADDHAPTRADIRDAVEQDERFVVVAEASDGAGAVEAALRERPDLCLLDIRMPGSGIAVTRELTTRLPETKVVMITVSLDDDDLLNALRAGAAGYMLKDSDFDRLPYALMDTLNGGAAIPRRLVSKVVAEFRDHGPRRRAVVSERGYDLTSREWEVLGLLRQGQSTSQIATRLFVSRATVRSHVAALLKKLNVPDREALRRLDADN